MEAQTKTVPACACCERAAQVVLEYTSGERMTACLSCAELAVSELVKDAHGSYVPACHLADRVAS